MADIRYIGARYVPRFMGTYNPTQVYEALDVVDDGNGVLYISKQPVPINTPTTDGDYWAEYGRIQNVQDQIDAINDEIADMKDGSVTGSLQYQINSNDDEIADMKDGTVAGSLQSQINGETVTLAENIILYRIGKMRVLNVHGAQINTLTGITLSSNDRPVGRFTQALSYYGFLGSFSLDTDGTMSVGHYITYGNNTITDDSASTSTVRFTASWSVN